MYVGSGVTCIHEPWRAAVIAKNTNSKAACVFLQSSRQERKGEDEMKEGKKKKHWMRYDRHEENATWVVSVVNVLDVNIV